MEKNTCGMKITGIICEYNPFHNGHERHIALTKRSCDYVICAMSGAFAQRGGPCALDKWARAEMALKCGADAVFELPALFATRSARDFARGGVYLLQSLGADTLSFGCETDDVNALIDCANADFSSDSRVKEALSQGKSYPRAVYESAQSDSIKEILRLPNATLGVEYIRSIALLGGKMTPLAIKRDSPHDAETLDGGVSGSAMRNAIYSGDMDSALENAPEIIRPLLARAIYTNFENIEGLVLHTLRTSTEARLRQIADMSEGLEMRMKKAAWEAETLDGMLQLAKCKRYPMARIRRAAVHCVLNLTKQACAHSPLPGYARLLGFRKSARQLIHHIKKTAQLPVLTRVTRGGMTACLSYDIAAQDLFDLSISQKPGRDFEVPPVIVDL